MLITVALVANAYLDLLSLDKQLDVAHGTVQSREYSVNLFRQRFDRGDVSELELSQVESQYWLAKSQVPLIEADIAFVDMH